MKPGLRRALGWGAAGLVALGALATAAVWALNLRADEAATHDNVNAAAFTDAQRAQGAYLARAGNCQGCHSAAGGAPYAGGRALPTPFGSVSSANLTPDEATGLGGWTPAQFRQALRAGRSRSGRLLAPAHPYTHYTGLSDADADALFAHLQAQPAVRQPQPAPALRWPFGTQAALALWRAAYFQPGRQVEDSKHDAAWNRGAYLAQSLGHCSACHAPRNALGASAEGFGGGLMPQLNWYAPALDDAAQAGVAHWTQAEVVALLRDGTVQREGRPVNASGPMAEVVLGSTQHLHEADLQALATYLRALPPVQRQPQAEAAPPAEAQRTQGAKLYDKHCADCHGAQGEGVAGAYPALAGNRAVLMAPPANLVHHVLHGGFAPATAGHPRPFGMPPFANELSDEELAALLSHLRSAWGHRAGAVTVSEINRWRSSSGR